MLMYAEEDLSLAAMHRILKKAGADRVSESACKELAKVLEEIGVKIGGEALDWTNHAARKTVRGKDMKIAAKKVLNP
jgi:histone H3/H4